MAAKEKADHYTIIYGKDFLKELKNIIEKEIENSNIEMRKQRIFSSP